MAALIHDKLGGLGAGRNLGVRPRGLQSMVMLSRKLLGAPLGSGSRAFNAGTSQLFRCRGANGSSNWSPARRGRVSLGRRTADAQGHRRQNQRECTIISAGSPGAPAVPQAGAVNAAQKNN